MNILEIPFLKGFSGLLFFFTMNASEKILIMTHAHSRPDFIEIQSKTFNAFLDEEYEFVVFNDAPNESMRRQIEITCQRLNINCVRVPQHIHRGRNAPSQRHCDCIKYSLQLRGYGYNGIVLMLDSDMFLVKPFSCVEYCKDYDFIGDFQSRKNNLKKVVYSSPALVFMNMQKLPNKRTLSFECGKVDGVGCDTGGYTYYYFKNNPTARIRLNLGVGTNGLPRDQEKLCNLGYGTNSINFIFSLDYAQFMAFYAHNNFIHYYAGGSNWAKFSQEFHNKKTLLLNNYIDMQLADYARENHDDQCF